MSEGQSDQFSGRVGLIFAAIGAAIGTGNIWRFPRMVGANGGGTFLVPWLFFLFAWSIPLVIAEFALGKRSRTGTIGTFRIFAGKKFGNRPFIANVSPNKTLEGFLFAIVISPILLILPSISAFPINLISLFLLIFIACCFSVVGDGFASLMKRTIGIKDYSSLIPGHGGVFDRLDSHIAAFPCFILFLNLITL